MQDSASNSKMANQVRLAPVVNLCFEIQNLLLMAIWRYAENDWNKQLEYEWIDLQQVTVNMNTHFLMSQFIYKL